MSPLLQLLECHAIVTTPERWSEDGRQGHVSGLPARPVGQNTTLLQFQGYKQTL